MCRFVVMAVIMGIGLLGLHIGNFSLSITVHLECKGVTRFQRGKEGDDIITSRYLGDCY